MVHIPPETRRRAGAPASLDPRNAVSYHPRTGGDTASRKRDLSRGEVDEHHRAGPGAHQAIRLALALALLNDPDVLFLDEPTTGLDPQARRNVWGIIEQWTDRGKTVVLTIHSMEEAEALCRRVAIMDHGRIIALDSPDALIAAAGLESAVEIGDVGDEFRATVDELGLAVQIDDVDGRLVLRTAEPSRVLMEITQLANRMNLELRGEVSLRRATLEDLFLTPTGRQLRK